MVHKTCYIKQCVVTKEDVTKLTFHCIPQDKFRRQQWVEQIGEENLKLVPCSKICSRHFEPECFDRTGVTTRLRAGACPTLFLPQTNVPKVPQKKLVTDDVEEVFTTANQRAALNYVIDDHNYATDGLKANSINGKSNITEEMCKIYITDNNEIYVATPLKLQLQSVVSQQQQHRPLHPAMPINILHKEPLIINSNNPYSLLQLPIEPLNNFNSYPRPTTVTNNHSIINNNIYVISTSDNRTFNVVANLPAVLVAKTATANYVNELLEKRTEERPVSLTFKETLQMADKSIDATRVSQRRDPNAKFLDYEIVKCLFNQQYDELFCRICLKHVEKSNKFELYPQDDEQREATAEVFRMKLNDVCSTTDLELMKNPVVCQTCYLQIEQSYDLKQKANDTEKHLRNILINYRYKSPDIEEIVIANKLDAISKTLHNERHRRLNLSKLDFRVLRSFKENPNLFDKIYDQYFMIRHKYSNRMIRNCRAIFYNNRYESPKPWLCEFCGIFFKEDRHRNWHLIKSTLEKEYICDICGVTQTNYEKFSRHKMIKHRQFKCKYCEDSAVTFEEHKDYMRHIREQHPEHRKKYQCDKCGDIFNTAVSLLVHQRRHVTATIPLSTCNDCKQQFKSKQALAKHLKFKHSKSPLNRCKLCGRHFWNLSRLKEHLVTKHLVEDNAEVLNNSIETPHDRQETEIYVNLDNEDEDPIETIATKTCYSCNKCGREFYQKRLLKQHEVTHLTNREVVCHLCKGVRITRMRTQKALQLHMRIYHSTDLFNKCTVCLKAFWKFQYLKDHFKRVHGLQVESQKDIDGIDQGTIESLRKRFEQEKLQQQNGKFVCKVCGKQFGQRSGLYQHNLLHRDHNKNETHPCKVCGKQFRRKINLSQHYNRIHRRDNSGDYSCQICKENGKTKSKILSQASLDKHMKIFHSNEPINVCEICGKSFWNLRVHYNREHNIPLDKIKCSKIIRDSDDGGTTAAAAAIEIGAEDLNEPNSEIADKEISLKIDKLVEQDDEMVDEEGAPAAKNVSIDKVSDLEEHDDDIIPDTAEENGPVATTAAVENLEGNHVSYLENFEKNDDASILLIAADNDHEDETMHFMEENKFVLLDHEYC